MENVGQTGGGGCKQKCLGPLDPPYSYISVREYGLKNSVPAKIWWAYAPRTYHWTAPRDKLIRECKCIPIQQDVDAAAS